MKVLNLQQATTAASPEKAQRDAGSNNKPYIALRKTGEVGNLMLEVIDGFLREAKRLELVNVKSEKGSVQIVFNRVPSREMNNYYQSVITVNQSQIEQALVRIMDQGQLISETQVSF